MYHGLFSIIICILLSGCAYSYAGQEGKNRSKRADPDNTKVVTLEKDPDGGADETTTEALPTEPEPESSPCGVDSFMVEQYAADGAIRKRIDCVSRAVLNVERVPLSDNAFQQRRAAGYPEGQWYIVVEPRSVADGVLNNDHLLQMSREFELDFHGRDSESGRLIYSFLSPVP